MNPGGYDRARQASPPLGRSRAAPPPPSGRAGRDLLPRELPHFAALVLETLPVLARAHLRPFSVRVVSVGVFSASRASAGLHASPPYRHPVWPPPFAPRRARLLLSILPFYSLRLRSTCASWARSGWSAVPHPQARPLLVALATIARVLRSGRRADRHADHPAFAARAASASCTSSSPTPPAQFSIIPATMFGDYHDRRSATATGPITPRNASRPSRCARHRDVRAADEHLGAAFWRRSAPWTLSLRVAPVRTAGNRSRHQPPDPR